MGSRRRPRPDFFAVIFLAALLRIEPGHAQDAARIALLDGPDRQKVLEDGARKEGTVVWYCSLTENTVLRPLAQAFDKIGRAHV